MAEIKYRATSDPTSVVFRIATDDVTAISNPLLKTGLQFQAAVDADGQLVHNGKVVSGPLAVDVWYTMFLTPDDHLRVRREDGHLEPYFGPDALIEEPAPVEFCGRVESGNPGSACVLPKHDGVLHRPVDGPWWSEEDRQAGQANLGLATTEQLLDELRARISVDHISGQPGGLSYTTVNGRQPYRSEVPR